MRATTSVMAAVFSVVTAEAQNIPIRQVGPAEAVSTARVDRFSLVRPLSDGRVIVTFGRSVGIVSADLKIYTSIVDSTSLTRVTGQLPQIGIITGRGDTTYVVDQGGGGLITVDPTGTAGRMVAVPKAGDMSTIAFTNSGTFRTYMDPKGRLWYRSARSYPDSASVPGSGAGSLTLAPPADSFPLIRADFDSRAVDTVAAVRIPSGARMSTTRTDDKVISRSIRYPFTIVDAWTVLQDGTIAIVRGTDYHVDWIHPDGSRSSTPKMQFDWRRISDEEKAQVFDSLQKIAAASNARDSARRATSRPTTTPPPVLVQEAAPVSTMPDYFPPVREGSARGDPDGNLWILPSTSASAQGGLLYDVVNRKGQVFERVQLPAGCALAGIAKGRVVYMICTATGLERRRILN